jgi:hypothetical protein
MDVELMAGMTFEDPEELWKFVRGRREYTHVEARVTKEKKIVYVAIPTNDTCVLPAFFNSPTMHHYELRGMGKLALVLKREKMSLQKLRDNYPFEQWINDALKEAINSRKSLLETIFKPVTAHPVAGWAMSVRGLGMHDALLFLGFIDPHICTTSGKACAYWNLAGPASRRRSGRKTTGPPILRGEAFFMAQRIWMRGDPYYKPLADAKREYYLSKLPEDEKGRRKHAYNRALLWLAHLLVSHAWEKHRKFEKLPLHPHANYIPPKPDEDAEFTDEKILNALKAGQRI